jgi:glycosyltransferase involved in cell wall biosynthesis
MQQPPPPPPSISVICVTFNRPEMVAEALDSVRAQTALDWECIVIDDGSADENRAAVEAYCARDERIRYVWQENAKLPAARNHGLSLARGEFIAFLDDDDAWLPEYLEATRRLLRERSGAVLAASPRLFWDGERVLEVQRFTPAQIADTLREVVRYCFVVPSQCVITRAGLDRTQRFRVLGSEDYDLWLQILRPGTAVFTDKPLVKYRVHAGGSLVDPDGSKRRLLNYRHVEVLRLFLRRRDLSLYDRLLALGNIQRKYEQILQFDLEEGRVPRSRLRRLGRLLAIVPTPILRSPKLAFRYLSYPAGRRGQNP